MSRYPNLRAADTTIKAMRSSGLLEAVDSSLVELVRTTARALDDALDEGDMRTVAVVARAHQQSVADLRKLTRDDDGIDVLLARLAEVGDSSNRKA